MISEDAREETGMRVTSCMSGSATMPPTPSSPIPQKTRPISAVNGVTALTHLDLALPAFGLGGCRAGFLMAALTACPPLREALSISEDHTVAGALTVGRPCIQPAAVPPRKPARVAWQSTDTLTDATPDYN
ncbi:MAG: hypothetical protein WBJ06_04250 [Candidatus Methanoculleus thermohydrogenotrophicum]|nr:hypothetical protein [Candidatus Methanoculleus thermohydrogenotrophicum]